MSLLIEGIQVAMWVGVFLSLVVFLPYPRFLRKPLIRGLEALLSINVVAKTYEIMLALVAFLWINSLFSMREFKRKVNDLNAQKQIDSHGLDRLELSRSIEHNKVLMFTEQRNIYLSFFVLVLYFVVFTYLKSLKRDDELHEKMIKIQQSKKKQTQQPQSQSITPKVISTPMTQEHSKDDKPKKD